MMETPAHSFDAAEILGEAIVGEYSLWTVALHAFMHKPLLVIIPAIPAALCMFTMGCFPHCAISEMELPLSGVLGLSRWGEWLASRMFLCVALVGTGVLGPGLADSRKMDRYAYGMAACLHAIPCTVLTMIFVLATGCNDSDIWLIMYIVVAECFIDTNTFMILCCVAVNRMRGMEDWWNPMNIRKRSIVGFMGDLTGFGLVANGAILPILYIAIDVAFIATSPVAFLRPIFTMALKKTCYVLCSQGFRRLGNSFKIWGLVTLSAVLGLNTAFAAVQCNSWGSLITFIVVDSISFLSRVWCHSGRLNNTTLGYYYRRYLLSGKSPPPDGIPTPVYRGFEIVIEGLGLSIGFCTMVIMFFLTDPQILPYPMLRNMLFPYGRQSFYYLLAMMASDFVQDVLGVVWVAYRIRYDFSKLLGHPLAARNLPYLLGQAGAWWI